MTRADVTLGRTAYQTNRLGALAPRYAFILNPYVDSRFTRCARCETKTNLRKLSLVIHVNGFGLVLLGKTCRLCLRCDTLVAHKAELGDLLRTVVNVPEPDYVVLGTIDRHGNPSTLSMSSPLRMVRSSCSAT